MKPREQQLTLDSIEDCAVALLAGLPLNDASPGADGRIRLVFSDPDGRGAEAVCEHNAGELTAPTLATLLSFGKAKNLIFSARRLAGLDAERGRR